MTDVTLATCRTLPEPDPDEQVLVDALQARDLDVRVAAWDDPAQEWADAGLVVIRSTWNYYRWPDQFQGWCDRVAQRGRLRNDADTVRWNSHKGYLRELEAAGLPIVPTRWITAGTDTTLAGVVADLDWERVVVKPTVSAGSWHTIVLTRDEIAAKGEPHFRALLAQRDVMVQPFLTAVEDSGERALVFVDGAIQHAIRKEARFAGQSESVSAAPVPVADDELALAQAVLAAVPPHEPLLYARVDLTRLPDGTPCVMELELIEPSLFLVQSPDTLSTFADAIVREAAAVPAPG